MGGLDDEQMEVQSGGKVGGASQEKPNCLDVGQQMALVQGFPGGRAWRGAIHIPHQSNDCRQLVRLPADSHQSTTGLLSGKET